MLNFLSFETAPDSLSLCPVPPPPTPYYCWLPPTCQLFPLPQTYTERGSGAVSDDRKLSMGFCYWFIFSDLSQRVTLAVKILHGYNEGTLTLSLWIRLLSHCLLSRFIFILFSSSFVPYCPVWGWAGRCARPGFLSLPDWCSADPPAARCPVLHSSLLIKMAPRWKFRQRFRLEI